MTAEPIDHDPLDPEDILRRLPHDERDRFIRDYRSALDAAHELWRYRQLQVVLRLWHMRATAFARLDFAERAGQARTGAPAVFTPADAGPVCLGQAGLEKGFVGQAAPVPGRA